MGAVEFNPNTRLTATAHCERRNVHQSGINPIPCNGNCAATHTLPGSTRLLFGGDAKELGSTTAI
jgi:hypothetical protein